MTYRVSGRKKLVLFIVGGLALILLISQATTLFPAQFSRPWAEEGVIDLTGWDFGSSDTLKLNGKWEFYWNKLLTSENINSVSPDLYAGVPSAWNSYIVDGQHLPGPGHGTYRLRVKTHLRPGQEMSLLLGTISSAYTLYINETEIAAEGVVASDPGQARPGSRPQIAEFTVPAREFDIILQVSNYHHARGGMWYSLVLGSPEGIARLNNRLDNRQLFFAGILVVMALTYFCLYVLRHQAREYLYLTLLALVLIVLTGTMHPAALVYRLFPQISYRWLTFWTYASISWTVTLLVLLTEQMFPARFSKQAVRAAVIYIMFLTLVYMLTPVQFYTGISVLLNIIGLLHLVFVVYLTVQAMFRGVEGSGPYMVGFIVAVLTYVHDTLLVNNYIRSDAGEIVYVGIAILFFVQTIVHATRFTRTYDEKITLLDKLQRLNQQKDEFMMNTAYQIRSPLTTITTLADELLARGELSAAQEEDLSLVKAFGSRAANLVNDILDYSFLKREGSLNIESVNLRAVAENVLQVVRMTDKDGQVVLENAISPDLPHVQADENRLYQILYSLVGNILKYCASGRIRITAAVSGSCVSVSVASESGLSPDVFSSLRCFLEDGEDAENPDSAELSLLIARQLIAIQGGRIGVKSAGDRGMVLHFTLPIATSTDKQADFPGSKAAKGNAEAKRFHISGPGPHILIVDDNEDTLKATANILGLNGFAVTAVNNGKCALELIAQDTSISVVLLDLIIPEKSGYEICREIRKGKSAFELPVLILTARTVARNIALAFDAGANDFLAKPFEKEELLARVRTLANLKQSVDKTIASEIAFLQAQIKPHFLYNALSVIAALTIANPDKARSLIITLSEYLRHSFSFSGAEEMVALAQEIELVDAYVAIERARFGSRLNFQVETDDYPGVTIPRLVLQPLVENAIRHGIYNLPQGGTVRLQVERKLNCLHFSVTDNGAGMDKEQVDSLFTAEAGGGVGLANINKRLSMYYGTGLIVSSTPGGGTTVSFSVPLPVQSQEREG